MSPHVSSAATHYAHVVMPPDAQGKEATIAGHRIRVRDIVAARDLGGLTPEEIAASAYPSLTLGQVYSALAYYEDHREEIDAAAAKDELAVERFRREHPELVRDTGSG